MLALGVVLLVVGVILYFTVSPQWGRVLLVVGAVLIGLFLLLGALDGDSSLEAGRRWHSVVAGSRWR